jgi:serine/threonine-protein kinase
MPSAPQTLGRYQLERVLGKGAMGIVYEALDPKLHRKVAIKTIRISQLDEETAKDFSARFVREAHAVARLNHPNIVQVYDFGEEGDTAYLVMEFIRGKELKTELAANPAFDRKECVRIMCELLDALDFAHEAGVIHRDIKPANVMLDGQRRTKLTDFGVARVTDADRTSADRTQAGAVVGTPSYMSPEQVQGLRVDRRTDIFSAGIVLYQFLTGQKPFSGEGAWTIARKIIQDDPPVPSSLNAALPPEFDRVVAKALAKIPEERFATARQFSEALRRAAEGLPASDIEPTLVVVRDAAPVQAARPEALPTGEMELEFWRSIKDSDDANDFELYIRQFPQGVYASLAGRKIARLRGGSSDDSGTRTMAEGDRTRVDRGAQREAPKPEAGNARPVEGEKAGKPRRAVLALGGAIAVVAAAYFFVKPGAVQPPAIDAGEKARRDADKAKAEAELRVKRDEEIRARREAGARAERETKLRARLEAEAKAKREAEEKAQREAAAKAKLAAESEAAKQKEAEKKKPMTLRPSF